MLNKIQEFKANLPEDQRIMALDIGEKRIGLAFSDPMQLMALPHSCYERINNRKDIGYLAKLAKEQAACGIVIGLPLTLENTETEACAKIRSFAAKLSDKTTLPVLFIDERMSTAAVTRMMQELGANRKTRHENDDKLAAAYLLQVVLDIGIESII